MSETSGWIKAQYATVTPGSQQTITFDGEMRWMYNLVTFNVGGISEYKRMYSHDMEGIWMFTITDKISESCTVVVTLSIIAPDTEQIIGTKTCSFNVYVAPKEPVVISNAAFGIRNASGGAAEYWEREDSALYCIRKVSDIIVTATFSAGYYNFSEFGISVGRYYKSFNVPYKSDGTLDGIPAAYADVPEVSRNSCIYGSANE